MNKKFIVGFILMCVFLLGGGVYALSATNVPQISSSENVKASVVGSTAFDWGTIPMNKGNVTKTFSIKNIGKDILKLYNVKTSCHCTKAYVTIDSKESPTFGMNTYSSWVSEVSPGKTASLTVVFDPAYHGPTGTGPMTRYVSVETNDSSSSKLTFTLTGTVVK